jgi:hypothetical protein
VGRRGGGRRGGRREEGGGEEGGEVRTYCFRKININYSQSKYSDIVRNKLLM